MWWQESDDKTERERVSKKARVGEGNRERKREGTWEKERVSKERMKGKGKKRAGERKKREGKEERSWKRKGWLEGKIERTILRGRDGMNEWGREGEWQLVLFTQFTNKATLIDSSFT